MIMLQQLLQQVMNNKQKAIYRLGNCCAVLLGCQHHTSFTEFLLAGIILTLLIALLETTILNSKEFLSSKKAKDHSHVCD